MGEILRVSGLQKQYSGFALKNVNFSLEEGYIMGFIGRNGAGKTTTIKAMLNMIHPDGGEIDVLGQNYQDNELALRGQIGLVMGGVDYYPHKKLGTIAEVTRRFYSQWDDQVFTDCMRRFDLDPAKRISQLSQGMRVKFALALALSHNARLLILDEPTSGLDPVSRDDLLELFQCVIEDGRRSILFSTHITSDLEKCADYITYIKGGSILKSGDRESFFREWVLIKGSGNLADAARQSLIGYHANAFGYSGLALPKDAERFPPECRHQPNLDEIMIHMERE